MTATMSTKNRKDVRLGKVDKLLISYKITNSWLFLFNSFDCNFSLRDSENQQLRTRVESISVFQRDNRRNNKNNNKNIFFSSMTVLYGNICTLAFIWQAVTSLLSSFSVLPFINNWDMYHWHTKLTRLKAMLNSITYNT